MKIDFTEKYRPKSFTDKFLISTPSLSELANMDMNNLPRLILHGAPGVGKTTSAWIIANETYPNDDVGNYTLELNASDDRKIETVRTKIKEFTRLSAPKGKRRILILDEADRLTKDAQHALRRIMERRSGTCLFILTCNNLHQIIEPIQSRCHVIKFTLPTEHELLPYFDLIAQNENITCKNGTKDKIVQDTIKSKKGVRRLLTTLQANKNNSPLTLENIKFLDVDVNVIWKEMLNKKYTTACELSCKEDPIAIINGLYDAIWNDKNLPPMVKADMILDVSLFGDRLSNSKVNSEIHTKGLIGCLMKRL